MRGPSLRGFVVVDSSIYACAQVRGGGSGSGQKVPPTIGASVRPKERKSQKGGSNCSASVCRSRRLETGDWRLATEHWSLKPQRPKTKGRENRNGKRGKDCEWGSDQSVPRWWVQVYWRGVCANSRSIDIDCSKNVGVWHLSGYRQRISA